MSRSRVGVADGGMSGVAVTSVANTHAEPSILASPGRDRLSAAPTVTSTDAKNEFGRVLDQAIESGMVVITKHNQPKAVLVSVREFYSLANASRAKLDTLSAEFDSLLARMQTPAARAGMKAAFDASPKRMGKAAVAMARKRG
jgi:antitoxin Phd